MRAGRILVVAWAVCLAVLAGSAGAATGDVRIPLPGHTLPPETTAKAQRTDVVAKSAEEPLTLTIVLRRNDPYAFAQLLSDLQDPQSPRYRRYLTPA